MVEDKGFGNAMPEAQEGPAVNLDNLRANSLGDEAFFREMLEMFVSQAVGQIEELKRLCIDGVSEAWVETAHALKGTAASVGAEDMRQLCAQAQSMAKAAELERRKILADIERQFERAHLELKSQGLLD